MTFLGSPVIPSTESTAIGNGQTQALTPAQVTAQFGAGNVKTASVDFSFPWNGSIIQFRQGVPVPITDPALLAALAAAGAPLS